MARAEDRLARNVPGDFYVDASCIDCDRCRQIAPATFADAGSASYVHAQPATAADERRALMALVACPTASIGATHEHDVRAASRAFPEIVAGEVYDCGYASEHSFGATSWLVRRPDGNVLVDSPRAAAPLLARLRELGGVRFMFLSHQDDVADHAKLRRAFGCERIIHTDDAVVEAERIVEGREPVRLADDLLLVPVPGHTRGSMALLYREQFLFTGDHLWGDEDRLHASRSVCWYSWTEQTRSMERLLDFRFEWVLPGHGRAFRAASPAAMRAEIERLVGWMKRR